MNMKKKNGEMKCRAMMNCRAMVLHYLLQEGADAWKRVECMVAFNEHGLSLYLSPLLITIT